MVSDPWIPVGYRLPDGGIIRAALDGRDLWQLYDTSDGRALFARDELARRWKEADLLPEGVADTLPIGELRLLLLRSSSRHTLVHLDQARSPASLSEAMAFAVALRETRKVTRELPLHDAIYCERYSRLLPTLSGSEQRPDDLVLGSWLSGGAQVSARSFKRLSSLLSWLSVEQLHEVLNVAGVTLTDLDDMPLRVGIEEDGDIARVATPRSETVQAPFRLPGRVDLERFFQEHVVDIVVHVEAYRALGIEFPSPIALHGPPGCGKTFAVERLVEYLGWPMFSIDSSSIGSPYIHETGKKIARAFDDAMKAAPSIVVIDEMDAFLSDRQTGGGQGLHHVEEVAEFLRRIPEAIKNHVLLIGMTNRIDLIDPAILRRGRFDHVVPVGMPSIEEVRSLLDTLLEGKPGANDLDREQLVLALIDRPLSDVAFVVREGSRLTARAGHKRLTQEGMLEALRLLPGKTEAATTRPMGFRRT